MRLGRDRERRCARIARGVAIALLFVCALSGCAGRTPYQQEFVELRTGNFVLTSSLSPDATMAFAIQLELFHAGVRAILGLGKEPLPSTLTPVYVFDDRSLGRPFAVENEATFLLDEVEAPVVVFRGGRDFEARATPDFRHRYAHRVLRDHAPVERPLWYEEGVAQLARTIEETDTGVVVGRVDPEWKASVLGWRTGELIASLQRSDVSEETPSERRRFEAQTWAIAHTLAFADGLTAGSRPPLDAYRSALDAPDAATRDRAFAATGLSPETLEKRIYTHLEEKRRKLQVLEIRSLQTNRWKTVALSLAESRARLGSLALRLERPDLALEYFDHALKKDPDHAAARIGRAVAAAKLGQLEVVEATFESAPLPPGSPGVLQVAAGDAHLAIAERSDSPERRSEALAAARRCYGDALADPQSAVRAAFGMARSQLVVGEDPTAAFEWLERVRAAQPGSLVLELWTARAEAAGGQARLAQIRARNVVSRTHDRSLEEAARDLIESAGGSGSR